MKTRRRIVAANWKMSFSATEVRSYIPKFLRSTKSLYQNDIIIFGQALYLDVLQTELQKSRVQVGAQNCHFELEGAFTGENSPQTLAMMQIPYVLVGHSERRHIFKESNDDIMKKVRTLHRLNITPVICVGETQEQRKNNQTEQIIVDQLDSALSNADPNKPFIVAYEPVWAIGTGQVATPEQAQTAHLILRKALALKRRESVSILYGGSVKPENSTALAASEDIDGFLVGGASLIPENFAQICNITLSLE